MSSTARVVDSQSISLDLHEFQLLHRHTGRHAVLDLTVAGDGKAQPVCFRRSRSIRSRALPIHVDLLVVNLQEEMTVDVPIVPVGESPAIDKMGGVLLHLHDSRDRARQARRPAVGHRD